ncbi:hypothetical protein LCGC14_0163250 [marine sediment metagenome]|uniref:Uncharacterized protein n=1 Tax=marine sediment metagenome TaxID=412755 RepID=A0A0F9XCF8_9ZZZZ
MNAIRQTLCDAPPEISGTLGWYHPGSGVEVCPPGEPRPEHTKIIREQPERFGLTAAQVEEFDAHPKADPQKRGRPREEQHLPGSYNPFLIDRVIASGWVRLNRSRGPRRGRLWGTLYVHAITITLAQKAASRYAVDPVDEMVVDIGLVQALKSFRLDRDEWRVWVHKGKLPVHAIRKLREDTD